MGRAQQGERPRRIGVLVNGAASDPEMQARVLAFKRGLEQLGWSEGRNINIDTRFADNAAIYMQPFAKELVALQPDVSVSCDAHGDLAAESRTIPIVFVFRIRSDRLRLRREPGTAGRQRHRIDC